ncbi:MAG TPA: hypothetical protein VFK88_13640 [Gallionella sp.]|nr:hypothetical protein [Gallionella sp.]
MAVQILLKDRFNGYLAAAIRDVPMADRIVLDAGDSVAINFLGDAADALKTALSLRESLLNEDPNVEPRLQVSMGINLGPVRLVRDVNGQPCIVGDGINVAQRVMGFADVSQILVSRSYYDAVLRVAPQYASLFHYQGSRTDKHVREHEVFAIGYPEDKASRPVAAQMREKRAAARSLGLFGAANRTWHAAAMRLEVLVTNQLMRLRSAKPRQRAIYVGTVAVPLLLLLVLAVRLAGFGETSGAPPRAGEPHAEAASAVPSSLGLRFSARLNNLPAESSGVPATTDVVAQPQSSGAPQYEQLQESRLSPNVEKPATKAPQESGRQKSTEGQGGGIRNMNIDEVVQFFSKRFAASPTPTTHGPDATVIVDCTDGATVMVDGRKKGVISSGSLTFSLSPGKHQIGINDMTRGSIYSEEVVVQPGKTMTIKPNFCL